MKKIFAAFALIGLVLMMGTAGASDMGNITIIQTLGQTIVSVFFLACGFLGLRFCRVQELRARRRGRVHYLEREVQRVSA